MEETTFTYVDGTGEMLVVEGHSTDGAGRDYLDIGIDSGELDDHYYVTMNELEVAELVCFLTRWLANR